MEVGEMIPALLLALGVGGWWAYRYERRIYRFVHRPGTEVADTSPRSPAVAAPALSASRELVPAAPAAAVKEIERPIRQPCDSVLGWDAFTLTSTLPFDGTVLLSCRPELGAPPDAGELTLVLLIGDDARADQALALFEWWRARGSILRLRPTPVPGAIELFDARDSAIRAALLAA
jgi:hypothetical protein